MGFRWGWWWKRGEGEGGPFWKRAPLPPRAPPSPPKTFTQVGMARPRRWAQGLSSPQTGKGAGEAGGERAPPVRQMPGRQQGTDDRGGFRGIFKREKWKEDWQKRAFVCHAATHKSSRWGNRPEAGQAVPVTTRQLWPRIGGGNETDAAYCCFINDFDVIAAAELRASRATLRGGEGEPFRRKGFPLPLA